MVKKSIYNRIAKNLREESSQLLGSIQDCLNHNAIDEDEARRLRILIYEFYDLSYKLDKNYLHGESDSTTL